MSCLLFKALIQDGFRCVISGLYDINSVKDNKELEQLKVEGAANADKCTTQCAHILPESTNAKISGSNAQPEGDKVFFSLLA